jgi:integrase
MYKMPTPKKDRHGTYYLRFNIPLALKALTVRSCLKRSLGTKNKAAAFSKSSEVWVQILEDLDAIKNSQLPYDKPTTEQIESICAVWYDSKLRELRASSSEHESWAFEKIGYPFVRETPEAPTDIAFFWNTIHSSSDSFQVSAISEINKYFLPDPEDFQSEHRFTRLLIRCVTQAVREPLTKQYNLRLQPKGQIEAKLSKQLLYYFIKLKQYCFQELSGATVDKRELEVERLDEMKSIAGSVAMAPTANSIISPSQISVSSLVNSYSKNLSNTIQKHKATKRLKDYQPSFTKFIQYVGDIHLSDLTVEHIRSFRDLLYDAPKSQTKIIRALPLRKKVEYARDNGLEVLSSNTVRNHIVHISALFEFGSREGYLNENIAKNLVPSKKERPRFANLDKDLDRAEVELIFSQPFFQKKDFSFFESRTAVSGEALYWILILIYYYGARLAEVSERNTNQIFKSDRHDCYIFRIDESAGGTLKETSSVRDLPLPNHLIELGFLDYVKSRPKNGPLFIDPRTGSMVKSENVRKALTAFLKSIDTFELNDRPPTHMFRHTLETYFRESGVDNGIRSYITGRARETSSEGYGAFITSVKQILEQIPRVPL